MLVKNIAFGEQKIQSISLKGHCMIKKNVIKLKFFEKSMEFDHDGCFPYMLKNVSMVIGFKKRVHHVTQQIKVLSFQKEGKLSHLDLQI